MPDNAWLWLILGGVVGLFVSGRWSLALAAWLAPVFLLQFMHAVPWWVGVFGIWGVTALATGISHWRVVPVPWFAYPLVIAAITFPIVLPFLADRVLAVSVPGLAATLVFPAAWVAMEYIGARLNPFGTWGALAYTQTGNRTLLQLVALAGIWGVAFVVTWPAAIVRWMADQGFAGPAVAAGVIIYALVLAAVLVYGRVRLGRSSSATRRVSVATVGWPEGILEIDRILRAFEPNLADAERDELRAAFARVCDHFRARTAEAARAGARIVVWPEANIMVFRDDHDELLGRLQALAIEQRVYLLAGIALLDPAARRPFTNKAMLFDPEGRIVASYTKATAVPGFETRYGVRGDGQLPQVETPYGRLTVAICYDLDFPWLLRQAGRQRAELLLAPASDWREIGALHHASAVCRAVENGMPMVRATRWGLSTVVDAEGRVLARQDHFAGNDRLLVAEVPVTHRPTRYARSGDYWALLCVAAVGVVAAWSLAVRLLGGGGP